MSKAEETPMNNEPHADAEEEGVEPDILPNELNISAKRFSDKWVPQIHKKLLEHDPVILGALGKAMTTLSDAVQALKAAEVAEVESIETQQVSVKTRLRGRSPMRKTKLRIVIKRGKNYRDLFDYRLRKTLKLFDSLHQKLHPVDKLPFDDYKKGNPDVLPVSSVQELKLDFGASDGDKSDAAKFLGGLSQVSAKDFAKYVSLLVPADCTNEIFDAQVTHKLQGEEPPQQ